MIDSLLAEYNKKTTEGFRFWQRSPANLSILIMNELNGDIKKMGRFVKLMDEYIYQSHTKLDWILHNMEENFFIARQIYIKALDKELRNLNKN